MIGLLLFLAVALIVIVGVKMGKVEPYTDEEWREVFEEKDDVTEEHIILKIW